MTDERCVQCYGALPTAYPGWKLHKQLRSDLRSFTPLADIAGAGFYRPARSMPPESIIPDIWPSLLPTDAVYWTEQGTGGSWLGTGFVSHPLHLGCTGAWEERRHGWRLYEDFRQSNEQVHGWNRQLSQDEEAYRLATLVMSVVCFVLCLALACIYKLR